MQNNFKYPYYAESQRIASKAGNGGREDLIYYYHGNHLSSTQTITDGWGYAVQQVLYAPFGEVVKERNQNWNNNVPAYLFNAKELDEESGMYYFEARYMKPPMFISRDPLFEKYTHFSPYAAMANSPIRYIDPTGMIWDESELTAAQKEKWQAAIKSSSQSSAFKKMYNELAESETVYKVNVGNTVDDVSGQYNKENNTLTFKDEDAILEESVHMEEIFHAPARRSVFSLRRVKSKALALQRHNITKHYTPARRSVFSLYRVKSQALALRRHNITKHYTVI